MGLPTCQYDQAADSGDRWPDGWKVIQKGTDAAAYFVIIYVRWCPVNMIWTVERCRRFIEIVGLWWLGCARFPDAGRNRGVWGRTTLKIARNPGILDVLNLLMSHIDRQEWLLCQTNVWREGRAEAWLACAWFTRWWLPNQWYELLPLAAIGGLTPHLGYN